LVNKCVDKLSPAKQFTINRVVELLADRSLLFMKVGGVLLDLRYPGSDLAKVTILTVHSPAEKKQRHRAD
jgi:hypothetical protein